MGSGSVVFVDFDNVFMALWNRDAELAFRFASDPGRWLDALAREEAGATGRWLVARCYLNPSGWVAASGERDDRLWFYRFRSSFVEAGFEVVDCPPVTRGAKNAADIRMVIDALDLLNHRTRFDEFVFVSGDSDFTPLLHRLRAEDRLTAIVSPGYLAAAYASVADRVMSFDRIAALLADARDEQRGPPTADDREPESDGSDDERAFASLVRRRFDEARAALNLSVLSREIIEAIPSAKSTEWFGHATFRRALSSLALPAVRFGQHHVWAEGRHQPPAAPINATVTEMAD